MAYSNIHINQNRILSRPADATVMENDDDLLEDEHAPVYNLQNNSYSTVCRMPVSSAASINGADRHYDTFEYHVQEVSSPFQTNLERINDLLPPHLSDNSATDSPLTSLGSPTFVGMNNKSRLSAMANAIQNTTPPFDYTLDGGDNGRRSNQPTMLENYLDADRTLSATAVATIISSTVTKSVFFDGNVLEQVSSLSKNLGMILNHIAQEGHDASAKSQMKHTMLSALNDDVSNASADTELLHTCMLMKEYYEAKLSEKDVQIQRLTLRCDDFQSTSRMLEKHVLGLTAQVAQLDVENQQLRMYEDWYISSEGNNKQDAVNVTALLDQLGLELGFEPLLLPVSSQTGSNGVGSSRGLNIVSEYKSDGTAEGSADDAVAAGSNGGRNFSQWPKFRRATLAIVPGLQEKFAARRKSMGLKLDVDVTQAVDKSTTSGVPKKSARVEIEMKPMQSPSSTDKTLLSPSDVSPRRATAQRDADGDDEADTITDLVSFHKSSDITNGVRAKFTKSPATIVARAVMQKKPKPRSSLSNPMLGFSFLANGNNNVSTEAAADTSRRDSGRYRGSSNNPPPRWSGVSLSPQSSTSSASLLSMTGSGSSIAGLTGAGSSSLSMIDERAEFDASQLSGVTEHQRVSGHSGNLMRHSSYDADDNGVEPDTFLMFTQTREQQPAAAAENTAILDDKDEKSRVTSGESASSNEDVADESVGGDGDKKSRSFFSRQVDDLISGLGGLNMESSLIIGSPNNNSANGDSSSNNAATTTDAGDLICFMPTPPSKKQLMNSCKSQKQSSFACVTDIDHPLSPKFVESSPNIFPDLLTMQNNNFTDDAAASAAVETDTHIGLIPPCGFVPLVYTTPTDAVNSTSSDKQLVEYRSKLSFLETWFTHVVKTLKAEPQLPAMVQQDSAGSERFKIRWAKLRKIIESLSTHPSTIDTLRDEIKRQKRQIRKLEEQRQQIITAAENAAPPPL